MNVIKRRSRFSNSIPFWSVICIIVTRLGARALSLLLPGLQDIRQAAKTDSSKASFQVSITRMEGPFHGQLRSKWWAESCVSLRKLLLIENLCRSENFICFSSKANLYNHGPVEEAFGSGKWPP